MIEKIKNLFKKDKFTELEKELLYFLFTVRKASSNYITETAFTSDKKQLEKSKIVFDNNILSLTNLMFEVLMRNFPEIGEIEFKDIEEAAMVDEWKEEVSNLKNLLDHSFNEEKRETGNRDKPQYYT